MRNINKYLKEFGDFLLVKKGIRKITIDGYKRCVQIVLKRIGKSKPRRKHIKNYMIWMHGQDYSYSHLHNTSLALEWYMKFLKRPLKLGRQSKPKTIVKDTLTEAEITRILFNCKSIREQAIIGLLAYSGIRNLELCNLRVGNLDLAQHIVLISQGKGAKDRMVYISSSCVNVLQEYLLRYPRKIEDFLFTTLIKGNKYHTFDLRKLIKTVSQRAKVEKRAYPHLFRHSLAVNMLKRGADIMQIKNQLGHQFLDTTMIYLRSLPYAELNTIDRIFPSYI